MIAQPEGVVGGECEPSTSLFSRARAWPGPELGMCSATLRSSKARPASDYSDWVYPNLTFVRVLPPP